MTERQGRVVVVLLATLLLLLAFGPIGGCSLTAPAWEYRIESIEDENWQSTMSELGARGWDLTAARRAVRGEGTEGHGLYECIFKRPKALFRISPPASERTPTDKAVEEFDRMRKLGREGN
jgi:hypothetical protein